jgi:T5SS/PEP-CTERM-associated repeat protein
VDGIGSQLSVAGFITSDGPQKITVQNLGQGSSTSLSKAFLIVRDAGSLFLYATKAEDSFVQILNGGRVNGGSFIGPSAPTRTAGLSVSGPGSALMLSGNLDLGNLGEASVVVNGGGRLECAKSLLDGGKVGGNSSGSVFGADSFWLANNGMAVGTTRGVATLNLGTGGRVEVRGGTTAMALGLGGGSEGRMDVDGGSLPVPSALDTRQTAETGVGVDGKGSLSVRSHGRILTSKLTLGLNSGSEGSVDVIGAGTSLEAGDTLEIGRAGMGRLTIFSGGVVTAPDVLVGSNSGTNLLRLTGAGSTLMVSKALRVGADGIGQLSVEQGSQVILTGAFTEPDLTGAGLCDVGGKGGATGYVSVKGPGSALLGLNGFLNLGLAGSGNLTVTNGGVVSFAAISVVGGQNRSSTAAIAGAGSVVRARDSLGIGAPFPGPTTDNVTVTAGGLLESKSTLAVGKTGILRLTGGSAVAGQAIEAPIPGTVLVANFGRFYLGGRLIGSVVVRQGGTFLPGFSPGHAAIDGNLTMAVGTSLEIELAGNAAGGQYDQIEATGTVTLAGHLDIVFRDGFSPTNGQTFEVVKGGSVGGTFSDVTVKGLAPGFTYSLDNSGGKSLRLTATSSGVATSRPELTISPKAGTNVVVSWPGYITGWTLQNATGLPSVSWQPISAPGNTVTLPISSGSSFFRLTSP